MVANRWQNPATPVRISEMEDQLLGRDKVGYDTAEQIGNHAEYAKDGAQRAHLGVGQVIRLEIRVIVIGPEIRQSVDQGAGHCQD